MDKLCRIYQEDLGRFLEVAQRFKLGGLNGTEDMLNIDRKENVHQYTTEAKEKISSAVQNKNSSNAYLISKSFSDIAELDQKIEENILKDKDGMLRCGQCPKVAITRGHLKAHIETHFKDLLFQCLHCPKNFQTRGSLSVHQYKKHRLENC